MRYRGLIPPSGLNQSRGIFYAVKKERGECMAILKILMSASFLITTTSVSRFLRHYVPERNVVVKAQ